MKSYIWDDKKNQKLVVERKISFEEIVSYIEQGNLLDTIKHPNEEKYSEQKIFVVKVENYIYLVPFVEREKEFVLKTIIPSRKATRLFLKGVKKNV